MTCDTTYPILLVHGAGFRDRKHLRYWGRIPKALEAQGAQVFYGEQDAWGSVPHNAGVLKQNLERILAETGCEKVNIIAHSKGGLDARYMISALGMAAHTASLTTIATPHWGSKTVDALLKLPRWMFLAAAGCADLLFRLGGDSKPDFAAAAQGFSTAQAAAFNEQIPNAPDVYYQSYAAAMKHPFSDMLMLFPYLLVCLLEGECDGLVTVESAKWGEFRGVLRGATGRGISHADEVDIRRMNFTRKQRGGGVSDIRQVYIGIVAELKQMGF